MNILLLTDGIYPYVLGGMQKHSYYLAKYLSQNGIKVSVVHCVFTDEHPTNYSDNFSPEELKNINFKCFTFPIISKLPGHYIKESYQYSVDIYDNLETQIESYDIIYAQGFVGWRFIEKKRNKKSIPPILINFHGLEMFQKAPNFKIKLAHYLLRGPAKWNLLNADYVLSFGGHFENLYHTVGVEKNKIIETPIGIESNWLNKNPKNSPTIRKFVFVGRYERRKGIEELNQALLKIKSSQYSIEFIGPIPESKKLDLPSCYYHGMIKDQEKIKQILQSADILICPSHAEGMPTVIMEAMASGLAIIATNVGAISKQINGNGWLIATPEIHLIKDAIIEAIQIDDKKLIEMKMSSIQLIQEKFLWNKVIDQLIKSINKIIDLNE